jgi:hypothetical protein
MLPAYTQRGFAEALHGQVPPALADPGEWVQASVPVLHGPAENAPWVEWLRQKIHPPYLPNQGNLCQGSGVGCGSLFCGRAGLIEGTAISEPSPRMISGWSPTFTFLRHELDNFGHCFSTIERARTC